VSAEAQTRTSGTEITALQHEKLITDIKSDLGSIDSIAANKEIKKSKCRRENGGPTVTKGPSVDI